jgi:hypothetical protein
MEYFIHNLKPDHKPSLSAVQPLTSTIVNVFIVLNFIIALAIYFQAPNSSLIIIDSYMMSYFWVVVFILIGLMMLSGKLTNNWIAVKIGLILGLFVKSIFTYGLIVLGLTAGFKGIIGVTGLWLAVTSIQFATVRNFNIPGAKNDK